jgi:hypothetical protein
MSYPSPNALPADNGGFYPASSQQQQQSGLSNPDELQLTAQLSRGLAPIMNAGGPDGQDPRASGGVNPSYQHDAQTHAHLQPAHSQLEHLEQMSQMGGQYGASPDSSMTPRKRSKVSRACDECRRKKIRCDATGETGDEQCSNCKRVGTRCQFSREPMKRGPSKGYVTEAPLRLPANMTCSRYIKELADRLQNLERDMQAGGSGEIPSQQYLQHHDSPLQRRGSDELSPPPNTELPSRKRTYSSVSNEFNTPYQPHRGSTAWAPQEPPRHLPSPFGAPQTAPAAQMSRDPNYSPNGLQPTPKWRGGLEPVRRQSSSFESMVQGDQSHGEPTVDWDETIVDG